MADFADALLYQLVREKHRWLHVVEGKAGRQDDDIGGARDAQSVCGGIRRCVDDKQVELAGRRA